MSTIAKEACMNPMAAIIPPAFKRYFQNEKMPIIQVTNLLPRLEAIDAPKAAELRSHLDTLINLKLPSNDLVSQDILLMSDTDGATAIVAVCQDEINTKNRDPAYGPLEVIGGTGNYATPEGKNPVLSALYHANLFARVMIEKCWQADLPLSGMKAIIPEESDWLRSRWLRLATGFAFSPAGVYTKAITGTDAGQTQQTIADMYEGSQIGGGVNQIAGMIPELDTPTCCDLSLLETHAALRELYPDKIPPLQNSSVLIEGLGRIGMATAQMVLREGGRRIRISDPLLTDEDELLPEAIRNNPQLLAQLKADIHQRFNSLVAAADEHRVRYELTGNLLNSDADIFFPSSTAEGSLNEEKLNTLHHHYIELILSGANNPLGEKETASRAALAAQLGIKMPHYTMVNCGSVTAAAMEPIFRARYQDATQFKEEVVRPHVAKNTREKLALVMQMIKEDPKLNLYTATEAIYRRFYDHAR